MCTYQMKESLGNPVVFAEFQLSLNNSELSHPFEWVRRGGGWCYNPTSFLNYPRLCSCYQPLLITRDRGFKKGLGSPIASITAY